MSVTSTVPGVVVVPHVDDAVSTLHVRGPFSDEPALADQIAAADISRQVDQYFAVSRVDEATAAARETLDVLEEMLK